MIRSKNSDLDQEETVADPISCTPSEFQVLVGAARGQTLQAIAETRGVTRSTVRQQLDCMIVRNDVRGGRAELVARAVSNGLVIVTAGQPAPATAVRRTILSTGRGMAS
jgi:DNA-binding NarL/FixJ family response regulator